MGKQINFFMGLELERLFTEFILLEGEILFKGDHPKPFPINYLPAPFSINGWSQLFLYKSEFGELSFLQLDNGEFSIDRISSPVIEFSRTVINKEEKEIYRGRLWLEMKFWNEKGEFLEKCSTLNTWYMSLNKWIKKHLPKTEFTVGGSVLREYVDPAIKELAEIGYKFY
jgi:hypothetical protein